VLLAIAFALATLCPTALGSTPIARADVAAQACSAHAVVVVEPGPGPVVICFDGTISGLDALRLAGANPVTYGFAGQGAAVCELYGVGNPPDQNCLIGPGGKYWAYFRAGPGAGGWTYARGGAGSSNVTDGSVEGWSYGTGGQPGFVSYCSMVSCAPPATDPQATDLPAPPPTAAPPATAAPGAPSATPGATAAGGATPTTSPEGGGNEKDVDPSGGTATTTPGDATTTTGKATGTATATRSNREDDHEVAADVPGGDGDGGGGSPVGAIVAVALVAVAVGGGLWVRARRRGPTPG
jgi:hypothetical protein